MAKSNSFFSIRRGSTKSHTFQGWQGQQVTKDRVSNVKNPRSQAQQNQRMKFAAVGNFYKYLKFILNHAWEGVSYGVNSYSKFMSLNVKNFNSTTMIIPEYGSKVAEAGTYQVSEGSLPDPQDFYTDEDPYKKIVTIVSSTVGTESAVTVADLKKGLFINDEDYITIVGLLSNTEPDGSPNVNYQTKGFAVRLHKPTAANDVAVTADNVLTLLAVETINWSKNDIEVKIQAGTADKGASLDLSIGDQESSLYILCYTVIGSKADNSGSSAVLRSNAIMKLSSPVSGLVSTTNANNIASWPVGVDYFLNGEHIDPTVEP